MAHKGLTAGRFYTIYNEEAAVAIEDPAVRTRFENKRDIDLAAINERIHQVEVERSYRIIGALENIASDIEKEVVPKLTAAINNWMRLVLSIDGLTLGAIVTLLVVLSNWVDVWSIFHVDFIADAVISSVKLTVILVLILTIHFYARRFAARRVAHKLENYGAAGSLRKAFLRNTRPFRSIFQPVPAGWSSRSRRLLESVTADASKFVQTMNDRFTNPSGNRAPVNKESENQPVAEVISVVETDSGKDSVTG